MTSLVDIYSPIYRDLQLVESNLEAVLDQEPYSSILKINEYILKTPGKRLRPALLLLTFRALTPEASENQISRAIKVATAIELLHMASLVHDDVVDHAPIRHNQETIASTWSNEIAILYGVYLYSLSLQLLSESNLMCVVNNVGNTLLQLCRGEINQVLSRHCLELSELDYLTVLKEKTGVLFRSSCEAGVLLSENSNPEFYKQLGDYAENLGVVFQLADDIMDIMGDSKTLNKVSGQDIKIGEICLPIIRLLATSDNDTTTKLKQAILNPNSNSISYLREQILTSSVLSGCVELGDDFLKDSLDNIQILKDSVFKEALISLIDLIRDRAFSKLI